MILYHGSFIEITEPNTVHSRSNVDLGRGFYVTLLYEQAAKCVINSNIVEKTALSPSMNTMKTEKLN